MTTETTETTETTGRFLSPTLGSLQLFLHFLLKYFVIGKFYLYLHLERVGIFLIF